jgi:hypothetical protein
MKALKKPNFSGSLDLSIMLLIFIKIFGRSVSHYLIDFKQTPPPPPKWTSTHTSIVKEVKLHVQTLPCLGIPTIDSFKIVETDASDIGHGGILKQQVLSNHPEQIVHFYSGVWNSAQKNYSTIKKEILSIVLCISKFQDDLFFNFIQLVPYGVTSWIKLKKRSIISLFQKRNISLSDPHIQSFNLEH